MITWGHPEHGGDSTARQSELELFCCIVQSTSRGKFLPRSRIKSDKVDPFCTCTPQEVRKNETMRIIDSEEVGRVGSPSSQSGHRASNPVITRRLSSW